VIQESELRIRQLEDFGESVRLLIQRHEYTIATCARNIDQVVDIQDTTAERQGIELQKLQKKFAALQAAVNQEAVVTPHRRALTPSPRLTSSRRGPTIASLSSSSTPGTPHVTPQKTESPTSPKNLHIVHQVPASDLADKIVEEGPMGILLKAFGQRLETMERYHQDYITRETKGDIPNIASTSASEELLSTLEGQPLESLGHQLLLTLGQQLMATIKQQVLETLQHQPETLEKQDAGLLEQHGSLEQRLFENLKRSLLATVEQRFLKAPQQPMLKRPEQQFSEDLERRTLEILEQQCMDSLRLQLENKFISRFEMMDSRLEERSHATRQLVKSRTSNLESCMLPLLDDKNERTIDLESNQKSMGQMFEKLKERVDKLAEHNQTLGQKNESLKRKVETLEEVTSAKDIESSERVSNEAASPDSEGRSSKRTRRKNVHNLSKHRKDRYLPPFYAHLVRRGLRPRPRPRPDASARARARALLTIFLRCLFTSGIWTLLHGTDRCRFSCQNYAFPNRSKNSSGRRYCMP
jgi:hypothetical protein